MTSILFHDSKPVASGAYALRGAGIKVDPKKHKEANEILRQQTSMLKARAQMVRWYSLFHRLGFIPSKEDIAAAHFELIGISNLTPRDSSDCVTNLKRSNKVKILLRLIDKAEQSNLLTE